MSVDVTRYLEMERAFYADLVARSNFETEAFTRTDSNELVVGSYVHHESMDYERWRVEHLFVMVPAQEYVAKFLSTFKDFPPSQKPGSFSIDGALEALQRSSSR